MIGGPNVMGGENKLYLRDFKEISISPLMTTLEGNSYKRTIPKGHCKMSFQNVKRKKLNLQALKGQRHPLFFPSILTFHEIVASIITWQ